MTISGQVSLVSSLPQLPPYNNCTKMSTARPGVGQLKRTNAFAVTYIRIVHGRYKSVAWDVCTYRVLQYVHIARLRLFGTYGQGNSRSVDTGT